MRWCRLCKRRGRSLLGLRLGWTLWSGFWSSFENPLRGKLSWMRDLEFVRLQDFTRLVDGYE